MDATVQQWIESINSQSVDRLEELASADHVFFVDGEARTIGRDKVRPSWLGYFEAFPSYQIFIDEQFALPDAYYLLGHTEGSHIPAELELIPSSVIWRCKIDEGKVSEWSIYEGTQSNREHFGLATGST